MKTQRLIRCLINPMTGKVTISRDISFFENLLWVWLTSDNSAPLFMMVDSLEEKSTRSPTPLIHQPESSHPNNIPFLVTPTEESSNRSPTTYHSLTDIYNTCSFAFTISDPSLYEEAAKDYEWQSAMREEMKSIQHNQMWELTKLPDGKQAVGLK